MPRVIQVIQSDRTIGSGTPKDPHRSTVQYHDLDGNHLATYDPRMFDEDRARTLIREGIAVIEGLISNSISSEDAQDWQRRAQEALGW